MSLQTENRDFPESGSADNKVDYQRFEHPELIPLLFSFDPECEVIPSDTRYPAYVRIYCPEIRVASRIACVFRPLNANDKSLYDLSTLKNQITAYRCINAGSMVARVGEIIGKHGVPFEFPKSDIEGIAVQTDDDCPFIDLALNLGFPGVEGRWEVYYHATSINKLKRMEWEGYISRVTMTLLEDGGIIKFSLRGNS